MRHLLLSILLVTIAANRSSAQWTNIYFSNPIAFGVHDSIFFGSEPSNVYTLEPTRKEADSGMSLGNGQSITAFGSIGSYVLAASNSVGGGGAYRSISNGTNWVATKAPQTNCFLTFDSAIYSGGGGGVSVSTDSGMNWSALSTSPHGVNALADAGTTLYAGTSSGVFRSTDLGQNWQATSMTKAVTALAVLGSVLFAGTNGIGVYRSYDNGSSWNADTIGLFNTGDNNIAIYGKYLFVGTGSPPFTPGGPWILGSGVFLSTDSGNTWDTIDAGLGAETRDGFLSINAMGIVDTLLFIGAWNGAGVLNNTYVRSIPEILHSKDTTSGVVQALPASDTIEIFPNPASGFVSIRSGNTSILGVQILNVLGETILNEPAPRESDVMLDLSKLPSGTYFVRFETAKGSVLRKLVKE